MQFEGLRRFLAHGMPPGGSSPDSSEESRSVLLWPTARFLYFEEQTVTIGRTRRAYTDPPQNNNKGRPALDICRQRRIREYGVRSPTAGESYAGRQVSRTVP